MEMIGHDHHLVTCNIGKLMGNFLIPFLNHHSRIVQMENVVFNISEELLPILRAKGYKIRPWQRIVVAFQPDAAPVMDIGVIRCHIFYLSFWGGADVGADLRVRPHIYRGQTRRSALTAPEPIGTIFLTSGKWSATL